MDKDLEAFEKWVEKIEVMGHVADNVYTYSREQVWLAACEYKNKEIEKHKKRITRLAKISLNDLDDMEKLQTEINELRNGMKGACHCCEPVGELNKKLHECVEFYANRDNWYESGKQFFIIDDMQSNTLSGGKRARQCLKELEEK